MYAPGYIVSQHFIRGRKIRHQSHHEREVLKSKLLMKPDSGQVVGGGGIDRGFTSYNVWVYRAVWIV